jgi:phage-related protein
MSFDLAFYADANGDMPVVDFLFTLSEKERAKSLVYMDLLSERGNALPAQYIKHIDGDLWELRPEFGGVEMWYFYFIWVGELIVFVHALKKKSRKTRPRDLELAQKRINELKT